MKTFNTSIFALILFLTSVAAAAAGGGRGRANDFEQQQHQRNLKKSKKYLFSPKRKPPIEDDWSQLLFVNATEYAENLQIFKADKPVFGNQTCDPNLNIFLRIRLCTGDTLLLSPTPIYSNITFTGLPLGFLTELDTVSSTIVFNGINDNNNDDGSSLSSSSEIVYGGYTPGSGFAEVGSDFPILGGVGRFIGVQGDVDQIAEGFGILKLKITCL
jgi:hypothetical protein